MLALRIYVDRIFRQTAPMSHLHYLPLAPRFFAILVGFFFIVLILRSGRCQALIYWFNKRRIVIRRSRAINTP